MLFSSTVRDRAGELRLQAESYDVRYGGGASVIRNGGVEDVHDAMATESAAMRDLLLEASRRQSLPPARP